MNKVAHEGHTAPVIVFHPRAINCCLTLQTAVYVSKYKTYLQAVQALVLKIAEKAVYLKPDRARRKGDEPAALIPRPVENRVLSREAGCHPEKIGCRLLLCWSMCGAADR